MCVVVGKTETKLVIWVKQHSQSSCCCCFVVVVVDVVVVVVEVSRAETTRFMR